MLIFPITAKTRPFSIEQLTQLSDIIVVANVESVSQDAKWKIAQLQVLENIKGKTNGNLLKVNFGGSKSEWVEDDPIYTIGEKDVVFLKNESSCTYTTVGRFSGKLRVDDKGLAYYFTDQEMKSMPLSDIINIIRKYLKKSEGN